MSDVRHLAVASQGLNGGWQLPEGKAGAVEVVRRLGYVQIDTLHVVQRAHHHAIWSRYPDYKPKMLHTMLAEERDVFEWWTHAASYIPMDEFRFYAPRMGDRALRPAHRTWIAENREVMDHVLARIQDEGALGTSDFKAPKDHTSGSWWSGWKPAKRALEVMFNQGVVLVSERRNFERIYDLRERIVPNGAAHPVPDDDEMRDYWLRRALAAFGALPEHRLWWWRRSRPGKAAIERGIAHGWVTPVRVAEFEDEPWYASTKALKVLDQPASDEPDASSPVHILSPFDNLIIRRPLMEMLFDFDYRMECYVPKAKRQYGYFSLPILWGSRFVGRVDTKADRASGTLILRHAAFEPDVTDYASLLPLLAREFRAFATFNECDSFAIEKVTPDDVQPALTVALRRV